LDDKRRATLRTAGIGWLASATDVEIDTTAAARGRDPVRPQEHLPRPLAAPRR